MKKTVAISVVLALVFSLSLTACQNNTDTSTNKQEGEKSAAASSSETLSGTVSKVDGNTITIVDDNGKETDITVTDATTYSFDMGDMAPKDGEMPEMPEGEEPPEMPEGGEMPEGQQPPQMSEDGERPEMPEGGERPEMPEDGEMPEFDGEEPPEMPEDGEMPEGGKFEPSLEMITEGVTITVSLASDGTAAEVKISMGGNFDPGNMKGGPDTKVSSEENAA